MTAFGFTFDANQHQPQTDFDPIPAGDYTAMIIDSAMKPTKNGAGQYLELTLQILEGQHAHRMIWDRLTLVHQNQKTVEIAQRQLSAICHAIGVLQVQDSTQLHNLPMRVRVKFVPADGQWQAKNEISSYKPANGAPPPAQHAPVQQQAAQAPAPQSMPWAQPPAPQYAPPATHAPAASQGGAATPPQAAPAPTQADAPPWARG